MKFFTKTTAAFVGAAVLLSAVPASAQINSINDLLQQVRSDSAKTEAENRDREAKFRQRRDQQAGLLSTARGELAQLERKASSVQSTFDANGRTISQLEGELRAAQGDFGEVFGLARSKAGEFKAILDSSLITAEYPERTQVLGTVAESKALPDSDQLNAIWQTMLQEIKAQRQVKTFTAPVANVNDGAEQSVTRVGPFSIFTADKASFLGYTKPSEESNGILLAKLPKPPTSAIRKAAESVVAASAGSLVYAPVDPTQGQLLKSFERVPTTGERLGNPFKWKPGHGGNIGLVILWVAMLGILFGVFNLIRLVLSWSSIGGQKRKAQPSKSNALGRVMMAYDGAKNKDADTVELKLDEAILRESPKFEFGLNLLKLLAGIAPLLGLLGTVTGMIRTFQAMMIYGTGDPQLMAGGISEALVTTMLGLIAAIPLLILHSLCSSVARSVQGTLEEQSAGIVARHVESRGV
ncbi:MAG: MotA/TolQ/ExbB proton channel family protein [Hellea sp.]